MKKISRFKQAFQRAGGGCKPASEFVPKSLWSSGCENTVMPTGLCPLQLFEVAAFVNLQLVCCAFVIGGNSEWYRRAGFRSLSLVLPGAGLFFILRNNSTLPYKCTKVKHYNKKSRYKYLRKYLRQNGA